MRSRALVAVAAACLVLLALIVWSRQEPPDQPSAQSTPSAPTGTSSATAAPKTAASATPSTSSRPPGPPSPTPNDGNTDATASEILLLVGEAESPNASERRIRNRLGTRGYRVIVADDDEVEIRPDDHAVVIISKTVSSTRIGDRLKGTTAGVLTWEDNAQAIEQEGDVDVPNTGIAMLAWIDLLNPDGTSWHAPHTTWHVDDSAPAELRAGLSGPINVYDDPNEMTFAPSGTLANEAITVASFGGDRGRATYYVYDRDARLPDGTRTPGRRVYFGLYDDTFTSLTEAGVELFDAAVDWAAQSSL